MKSPDSIKDFESSLGRLEEIVRQMEQGDLSLEQSLKVFEEGVKLTRTCQTALQEAQQRVEILVKEDDEGNARFEAFSEDQDSGES